MPSTKRQFRRHHHVERFTLQTNEKQEKLNTVRPFNIALSAL